MARKQFSITVAGVQNGARPGVKAADAPTRVDTVLDSVADEIEGDGAASLEGWAASLDQLFRRQAPRLLSYLSRRVTVREEAADLVQESFLRLIRMTREQDPPKRPEAYLQRIARNLLLNRARQALARGEHLHSPIDDDSLASGEPDPEEALAFLELKQRYEDALGTLSAKTRDVFLLNRREGYTYARIASELNQSVSNVEKHMMKAIAHLDRALGRNE